MKKTFLITVCCAILLAISPIAHSADGLYVSGIGGVPFPYISYSYLTDDVITQGAKVDLDLDVGYLYGGAIGYRFLDKFRIEEEITYQKNDIEKEGAQPALGEISTLAILLNGYYDFATEESVYRPFLSVGIGYATVETILTTGSPIRLAGQDAIFTYQVGIGLGYAINEKVTLDFRYRFQEYSDPDYGSTELNYTMNNFLIGIRVDF
ncbi:MAG: hypothetical protein AMJ79_14500 [Phycisphaerae bacterium SM23_30]|nr:MAG: hypothetical protein AMJ79_14500 [Phycisphaerae bacterium SM23_30]